jgi:putative DNA primase/helicase
MTRKFKDPAQRNLNGSLFDNLNQLPKDSAIEFIKAVGIDHQFSEWPDPTPINNIKKDLLPVPSLPAELIPEPYREWLVDIAHRMQCPLDYVAVGAIVVTASLIGAGCGIRPKSKDPWTVIPNLWGGIIGPPSKLKTPALAEVMKPLDHLEAEARDTHEKSLKNYLIELEDFKASKEAFYKELVKAASKSDVIARENAKTKRRNLEEPQTPICKRYSTNDATIEKMHELLSQNSRGLLLFRDELAGLLSIWDREDHKSDRCFYLEAWNGYGSKTMDRIGRGTIFSKNLCVSILGTTQPSKLLAYFQNAIRGIENDGLLQRFQLLVYPDEIKTWQYVDEHPNEHAQKLASNIMIKLAQMDFTLYGAMLDNKSGLPYYHFDNHAQEIFHEWITKLESKLRNNLDESIIIEHLAKYRKLMPALALIFHLIEISSEKPPGQISKESAEQAVGWCNYLEAHSRRIYDMSVNSSYLAARKLAQKIQARELSEQFDVRDVYRKEWALLTKREEAQLACEILIDHAWLKETTISEGGRPKAGYSINPKVIHRASA